MAISNSKVVTSVMKVELGESNLASARDSCAVEESSDKSDTLTRMNETGCL